METLCYEKLPYLWCLPLARKEKDEISYSDPHSEWYGFGYKSDLEKCMNEAARFVDKAKTLEQIFNEQAEIWIRETAYISSTTKLVMHQAYQRIIGMGKPVVPLLLRDLSREPKHWFWALNAITGEQPVLPEDAGNVRKMTKAWLEWGRQRNLI